MTTFVVTTLLDVVDPDDGLLSLREAIALANATPGADRITFAVEGTIVLQDGQLTITDDVEIVGEGRITLDGDDASRIVDVTADVDWAVLDGLAMTRGLVRGSAEQGGAVRNAGNLTLRDVVLEDNRAGGGGGGVFNAGSLAVEGSVLAGNLTGALAIADLPFVDEAEALSDGGAIFNTGELSISGSTFLGNIGESAGAIWNQGSLAVVNALFEGNQAFKIFGAQGGGAIWNGGDAYIVQATFVDNDVDLGFGPGSASGNDIDNAGTLTLGNSIFAGATYGTEFSFATGSLIGGIRDTGTLTVIGPLIVQDGSLTGTDVWNVDPLLGPLDGSGAVPTRTPWLGSTAIDTGDNAAAVDAAGQPLVVDLGGGPRFVDGLGDGTVRVDLGAVEAGPGNLPVFGNVILVDEATDIADGDLGPGRVSLREAIAIAELTPGPDTIIFAPHIDYIELTQGQLTIGSDMTILGHGKDALTISGGGDDRLFFVNESAADVTLHGMTLRDGFMETSATNTTVLGGAILNAGGLTVRDVHLTENAALGSISSIIQANGGGGAIANLGTLYLEAAEITDNRSGYGGAIFNLGAISMRDSLIAGSALDGIELPSFGAAEVYNDGNFVAVNSTIVAGSLDLFEASFRNNGTTTLRHVTYIGVLDQENGGILTRGTLTLANSLLTTPLTFVSGSGATPELILKGVNLLYGSSIVDPNVLTGDPLLGPLADNGGPTLTLLPGAGSPAIDAGDDAAATDANGDPLTTDQRGLPRFVGPVDLGAVEVQPAGPPGLNVIDGTPGDDVLVATEGDDLLRGFGGNDLLIANFGRDIYDGGAGNDTVDFSYSTQNGVRIDLEAGEARFPLGTVKQLISIENVIGTQGNDVIVASTADNVLMGGAGDDLLIANFGYDTYDGGAGNDTVDFSYSTQNGVRIDLAAGEARFPLGTVKPLISIENVIGTQGNDVIVASTADNVLMGGAGDDLLVANFGRDTYDGGAGNDTVDFSYSTQNGVRIELHAGEARFPLGTVKPLISIENVVGTQGNDVIVGDAGVNVLRGGAGDDVLDGGGGPRGGAYDVMAPGAFDMLIGGEEADTFVVSTRSFALTDFDFAEGDRVAITLAELLLADGTPDLAKLELVAVDAAPDRWLLGDFGDGFDYDDALLYLPNAAGLTVAQVLGLDTDGGDLVL